MFSLPLGKQVEFDDIVIGLEELIDITRRAKRRFGTAGAFPILFREAWKEDVHMFAAEGDKLPFETNTSRLAPPQRGGVAANVLNQHPVEILAVEENPNTSTRPQQRYWVRWLDKCEQANLPDYVLILTHASRELVEADGLVHTKTWRRRFQEWGYEAHCWFLRAHDHNGVVRQHRCMLILRCQDDSVPKVQRLPETIDTEGGP
jgi:hypothetical protein